MTEYEKAKAWRLKHGWTQEKLAELTGFARETIYWFERGKTPQGRSGKNPGNIRPWVWLRYNNACAGVDVQQRMEKKFNW